MTFDNYKAVVSEIANIPVKDIHKESSFKDDLCVDSLQMVNLIFELQTKFGVELKKIESNKAFETVESLYLIFNQGVVKNENIL